MEDDRQNEAFKMGALAVNESNHEAPNGQAAAKVGQGVLSATPEDEKMLQSDEQLVEIINRHPIGLVGIYAEMIVGVAIVVILIGLAVGNVFGKLPGYTKPWLIFAGLLVAGFIVAILSVVAYVYRKSRLLLADKSIVSTVQKSLFSRKIARLSLENVEDVTAEQRGILQTMFNYGTLTIQTAGEEDNFIFPLCPKPNEAADKILETCQTFTHRPR